MIGLISFFVAQGVVRVVETFTNLSTLASCVIIALSCTLSCIALVWWKEEN